MSTPVQIVSWSELDTARQCGHKHDLSYKQRWVTGKTSLALSRGTLWHAVMEEHYRTLKWIREMKPELLKDRSAVAAELYEAVQPYLVPDIGPPTDDQELIAWMYAGYVEHYGIDKPWQIVAVEQPLVVWLPNESGNRSRFKLKMKIDLVVKQDRRLWVVDHKSCKNLPSQKQLELNDQFGLYTWALRQAGFRVFGSLHSSARTQRNIDQKKNPQTLESRFGRKRLHRTDRELDVLAREAFMEIRDTYRTKHPQRRPNEDTCAWRCDYEDACLHGRKRGSDEAEREYLLRSGFVQDFTRH